MAMNWKKMAEAFGELAGRNMRRGKNSNVDAWSRNSANKSADTRKAFKEGESLGSDMQGIADELATASERGETRYNRTSDQFYDQLKEVNQSNRGPGQSLEKDFEKAFDDALSDRVKKQSEAEGRTKFADIKTLNDDLRQSAIEMLQDPNSSIADVFDILKRYDD